DTRGSYNTTTPANYGIIKAKDNNCWMTDNLNLYNRTVSYIDTDIPSGSFTIPNTSNWTSNDTLTAYIHRATNSGYTNQVYYNWCSSAALASTCNTTVQQDRSICPKGWTLPNTGNKSINKTLAKLLSAYSITTGSQLLANSTLGITLYYGNWHEIAPPYEASQGGAGRFWTNTPYSADETKVYDFAYNSSALYPQQVARKSMGDTIRCVAR
ncbi:hypothetical protein IKG16_02055, partial [Candidatus Saccharibacteria bacterium]|nr:hypothetical protein [Candidatus Saccharibacteria bacterium]